MKIFEIFTDEIKNIFTDAGAILIMVGGILMYSLFYAVPYANEVLREVPVGITDLDNSALSRTFSRNLNASELIEVKLKPADFTDAKQSVYKNKIKAIIVIPENFEKDVLSGKGTKISFYADSSYLLIYKQVATAVISCAQTLSTQVDVQKLMLSGNDTVNDTQIQAISKNEAMSLKQPFELISVALFNPSGGYRSYIYPAVLILILQQTLLVGMGLVGGTLREKRVYCKQGAKPWEIVIGKALAYFGLYFIYSILYFIIMPFWFNLNVHYNIFAIFALVIPYIFSICFLGQSLIYFFKERESSLMVLVVTSMPIVFLPGFVWPKEAIPSWLNFLSAFIPSTNAISAFLKVNQMGAAFYQVRHEFLILGTLMILYFFAALFATQKICQYEKINSNSKK